MRIEPPVTAGILVGQRGLADAAHCRQRTHPPLRQSGNWRRVQFLVNVHQIVFPPGEERVGGIGQIDDARRSLRRRPRQLGADRGEERLPDRLVHRQRVQQHRVPAAQRRWHHLLCPALGQYRDDGVMGIGFVARPLRFHPAGCDQRQDHASGLAAGLDLLVPVTPGGQADLVEPNAKSLRHQADMQSGGAVEVARRVADKQLRALRPVIRRLRVEQRTLLVYRQVGIVCASEPAAERPALVAQRS